MTLGDLMADMELTMEEAMTIGASKSGRRKKRSQVSPDVYLSAVLNTPALFERIYSYIHHETAFIHRRVARSFRKRFTTLKVSRMAMVVTPFCFTGTHNPCGWTVAGL